MPTPFEFSPVKLVYGGEALGFHTGHTVFAPLVLPGERVLVEEVRRQKGVLFARPLRILDRCFTLHLIVTTRTLGQTSAVRVRIITFFHRGGRRRKGKRLFQNRRPSVGEDQRQLVGEVFFLSLDDCAIVFLLGGARYGLHRLPRSQVSLFSGSEDPVQHSTYR
jgi:hypothetical protein